MENMTGESVSPSPRQTCDGETQQPCPSSAPWLCRDPHKDLPLERTSDCELDRECHAGIRGPERSFAQARRDAALRESGPLTSANEARSRQSCKTCPARRGPDGSREY